jgi:hypothetical protein
MGKHERASVYEMIERVLQLMETEKYPMDVAVGVVITKSLSGNLGHVDQPSMTVFRETLIKAVGAVWGLSAVVEADRSLQEKEGEGDGLINLPLG